MDGGLLLYESIRSCGMIRDAARRDSCWNPADWRRMLVAVFGAATMMRAPFSLAISIAPASP